MMRHLACYFAHFPALPGCFLEGETVEEIVANAKVILLEHIASLHKIRAEIPGRKGRKQIWLCSDKSLV